MFLRVLTMLAAGLFAILLCLVTAESVAAPPPAAITAVDFGYGNAMPAERWTPIRVTISANSAAFTGRLVVRYRQDSAQGQIISVPASVGPGASVPVEVVINCPGEPDEIAIRLFDADDRQVDSARYGRLTSNQLPGLIPLTADSGDGIIACVGRISAIGAVTTRWLGRSRDYYYYGQPAITPSDIEVVRMQRGARLRAVSVDPAHLSPSWAAYDSLEAMIIRPEEMTGKVNEDARRAVMQWVQAGGRLIIQVDQIGESWRLWLPPEIGAGLTCGDLTRLPCPVAVHEALRSPVLVDALPKKDNRLTPEQLMVGGQPSPDKDPLVADPASLGERLDPALTVPGRTIDISPSLARQGWRLEWTSGSAGLIAHGPVGFGHISIVGCDPALAASVPNNEATYRLWLSVLRGPLEDWLSCPDVFAVTRGVFYGAREASGANEHQRQAITFAFNALADEPSRVFNPFTVIVTVLACILILALCIGPLDAVILKRRSLRHYSWLSALGWILLLTAIATMAPRVIRGDLHTLVLRERIIDQIVNGPTWTASATGLFSGSPGSLAMNFTSPALHVRGASAVPEYGRSEESLPPIRSAQGVAIVENERIACTSPARIEQGQWIFRTMLDEGPGMSEDQLRVSLRLDPMSATLDIAPLTPDASGKPFSPQVRSATLRIGSKVVPLVTAPNQVAFSAGHLQLSTVASDLRNINEPLNWVTAWTPPNRQPMDFTGNLPGAQRRMLGFESRIRGGGFALLTLSLSDSASDLRTDEEDAGYHSIRNYRILIPIPRVSHLDDPAKSAEGALP